MKLIPLFTYFVLSITSYAAEGISGLACLNALPQKYLNGVLKLSADDASPNPTSWYVVAQVDEYSPIHKITVTGGQVVSDTKGMGIREIFTSPTPININKMIIDSIDAFNIAQRYASANGQTIGSVSFALTQKGKTATPIWSVWCYRPNGKRLGMMQLLATDGTVVANDAFPKKP